MEQAEQKVTAGQPKRKNLFYLLALLVLLTGLLIDQSVLKTGIFKNLVIFPFQFLVIPLVSLKEVLGIAFTSPQEIIPFGASSELPTGLGYIVIFLYYFGLIYLCRRVITPSKIGPGTWRKLLILIIIVDSFFFGMRELAYANPSPLKCALVLDGPHASRKSICLRELAIKSNDLALCDRIKDNAQQALCSYPLAIESSDKTACESIKEIDIRGGCYYTFANREGDPSICELAVGEKISGLNGLWMPPYNDGVFDESWRDQCLLGFAEDPTFCKKLDPKSSSYDTCYFTFGTMPKNIGSGFCDLVNNSNTKNSYWATLAIKTMDENICGKIVEDEVSYFNHKQRCILEIAEAKLDPSICNMFSSEDTDRQSCLERVNFDIDKIIIKNWQVYYNKTHGFELRYPPEWTPPEKNSDFIEIETAGPKMITIQVIRDKILSFPGHPSATVFYTKNHTIFVADSFYTVDSPIIRFEEVDKDTFRRITSTFEVVEDLP